MPSHLELGGSLLTRMTPRGFAAVPGPPLRVFSVSDLTILQRALRVVTIRARRGPYGCVANPWCYGHLTQ